MFSMGYKFSCPGNSTWGSIWGSRQYWSLAVSNRSNDVALQIPYPQVVDIITTDIVKHTMRCEGFDFPSCGSVRSLCDLTQRSFVF